jgi:hypothetical protein
VRADLIDRDIFGKIAFLAYPHLRSLGQLCGRKSTCPSPRSALLRNHPAYARGVIRR